MGHVEGQVAQQPHPLAPGPLLQGLPLGLKLPREQAFLQQGLAVFPLQGPQGAALTAGQGARPFPPGLVRLEPAQHHEQGVVPQPAALAAPPALKGLPPLRRLLGPAAGQGAGDGLGPLRGQGGIEPPGWAVRQGVTVLGTDQARLHQVVGIDQPGVEGRAAGGAVGRAGAVGGGQGQHLPDPDPLPAEQVDPGAGLGAEAAAAAAAGEGGGVEQDAAAAGGMAHGLGSR